MMRKSVLVVCFFMLLACSSILNAQTTDKSIILSNLGNAVFSPDDSLIAGSGIVLYDDNIGRDFLYIWDVTSGQLIRDLYNQIEKPTHRIDSLSWSPDSHHLVSGSGDGVIVWEIKNTSGAVTGIQIKQLSTGFFGVSNDVAWSPDGSKIAAVSHDNRIQMWDVTNNYTLLNETQIGPLGGVRWNATSTKLAVGGQRGIMVQSADLNTPYGFNSEYAAMFEPEGLSIDWATGTFDWSPDGEQLAITYEAGKIHIRSTTTGNIVDMIEGLPGYARIIRWDPAGERLAVGGGNWVEVWDVGNKVRLSHYTLDREFLGTDGLSWNSTGTQLVYGNTQVGTDMPAIVTPPVFAD